MQVELFEKDLSPEALDYFSGRARIGVDTETSGLDPRNCKLALVQVSDESGDRVAVVHNPSRDSPLLKELLAIEPPWKVFHNARFDLGFLAWHLGVRITNPRCTKILARYVEPAEKAHLQWVAQRYLGIALDKGPVRLTFVENPNAPVTEEVLQYAARDAAVLIPLISQLEARASPQQLSSARGAWAALPQQVLQDLQGPLRSR